MTSIKQRLWLNIALFAILLMISGLGYWAWDNLQENNKVNTLLPFSSSKLTDIRLERYLNTSKAEFIEFKQQGDKWFMVKPYSIEANPVKITQLITLVNEPIMASYPVQSLDLAQFDLSPVQTQITFNNQIIGFGKTNPITNQRYLLVDNQLTLVSEVVGGLVAGDMLDLIARTLVPTNTEVMEIVLPNGKRLTSLELRSNWQSASALSIEKASHLLAEASSVQLILKDSKVINFALEQTEHDLKLTNLALGLTYVLPVSWANKLLANSLSE